MGRITASRRVHRMGGVEWGRVEKVILRNNSPMGDYIMTDRFEMSINTSNQGLDKI